MSRFATSLFRLIVGSNRKTDRILANAIRPQIASEVLEQRRLFAFTTGVASINSVNDPIAAGGTETISFSISGGYHQEFIFCSDALTRGVTLNGVSQDGFGDVSASSDPAIYNFLPSPFPLPGAMLTLGADTGSFTATFPINPAASTSTSGDLGGDWVVLTGYAESINGLEIWSACTPFGISAASGPAVTKVSPAAGPVAGGATETITGSGFSSPATVYFGATQALNVKVLSPTQIICIKPPGAPGPVDVTVATGAGFSTTTTADQFTYVGLPSVTGISPKTGSISGKTVVTITGTNFADPATVNFGSVAATNVTVVSSTQITATSPSGSSGAVDVTVETPGGTSSKSTADSFTYAGGPTVSKINPAAGPVAGSTAVTITGTGFTAPLSVNFGTVAAKSVVVVSDTQITCVSPPASPSGKAGMVAITVKSAAGTSTTSSADVFSYLGVPTVSSIFPATGPVTGKTTVTISGTNFVDGATTVKFGAIAATNVTFVSASTLTVASPPAKAGTVDIIVSTAGGDSAMGTPDKFVYGDLPTVTALKPDAGPLEGKTTVTITGTGFTDPATVNFGTVAATDVKVVSATQITCVDPKGTAGDVHVTVKTAADKSDTTTADDFSYDPVPTVTKLNVSVGPMAGGTPVLISGTDFNGATGVKFGKTNAISFVVVSNFIVSAVAPPGMAGAEDITVITPGGTSMAVAADKFTYAGIPTVASISPTSGPIAGKTTVTITGSNFVAPVTVDFGSIAGTSVKVVSASQITVISPAGSAGLVDIKVSTPGGISMAASTDLFTYLPLPKITALTPAAGPLAGSTKITITGTGFTGATAVNFGTVPATGVKVVSSTQITATIPASTKATAVDITIVTPGGTSLVATADKFTYDAVPSITRLTPAAGPLTGKNTVTITGAGFVSGATVLFGKTPGTSVKVVSATSITVIAPVGKGAVDISVVTPGGTSGTSAGSLYTYTAVPTLTKITPTSGPTAGGATVTITGSNFTGATAVMFGSALAKNLVVVSPTTITVTSPANATGIVDVKVVTPGGTTTVVTADKFTSVPLPVVITLSAIAGPVTGGTSVTITGSNFTGATAVMFGTFVAASFKVVSPTQITAVSPIAVPSTVYVQVVTQGGTSATSLTDKFRFAPLPAITKINVTSSPLAGGATETITGSNFTGATAVEFGSVASKKITVVSATSITATIPAGTAGLVDITVITPGGTSPTLLADRFTYVTSPTVKKISLSKGPLAGGTKITITGTNFTGATGVKFGTVAATGVVVVSVTEITATIPAGKAGTVDVTITTPGGTSAVVAADKFIYLVAPAIVAVVEDVETFVG